jgi:squalene-hopene cyclase-like protein
MMLRSSRAMLLSTSLTLLCSAAALAGPAAGTPYPAVAALAPALTKLESRQEPDLKQLLDFQLSTLRLSQNSDGSYGRGLQDTAYVVLAFSLGPRAYRVEDGPFIRRAVEFLLRETPRAAAKLERDSTVALALAAADRSAYADTISTILGRHQLDLAALDSKQVLPDWNSASSVQHLQNLPSGSSIGARGLACARAVLAYRFEVEQKAAQVKEPAVEITYERGIDFLVGEIGESGMWEFFGQPEPGISALAVRALLGSSRAEIRAKAIPILDALVALQQKDGSIHGGRLPVYVTSVAIGALSAGGRVADQPVIAKASDYLRAVQTDGGEGYSESDKFYGGIGYGNDLRPDLSNLQYALQALHDGGAKSDDPAFQRALKFLERSQNLREVNPGTYHNGGDDRPVRSGDDGGGVYFPGNSMAGYQTQPDGTLVARSYGSMTYALLKCYIFAGLDASDARVAAALSWIERHWTLEVNPGFDTLRDPRVSSQGLYYYYLSLAQALQLSGKKTVITPDGVEHDWRREVQLKFAELQRQDGSWINELAPRWWEGNPVLCTAYALDALLATQQ